MTWLTDIIRGLRSLGREGRLQDLYRWIQRNRHEALPPNYESAIRATLQRYCSTARQYDPNNPDLFVNSDRGWWGQRKVVDPAAVKLNKMDVFTMAVDSLSEDELKA